MKALLSLLLALLVLAAVALSWLREGPDAPAADARPSAGEPSPGAGLPALRPPRERTADAATTEVPAADTDRVGVAPTGALEVVLVDSGGRILDVPGFARLALSGERPSLSVDARGRLARDPRELFAPPPGGATQAEVRQAFSGGRALLAPLPCGEPLRVEVVAVGRMLHVECAAPAAPGATARVEVVPERRGPLLVARVEDPSGAELDARALRPHLLDAGGRRTNPRYGGLDRQRFDATFALELPEPLEAQPGRHLVVERPRSAAQPHLYGAFDLSAAVPAGTHLLPPLRLGELDPLVRGRVADSRGVGLAKGRVVLADGHGDALAAGCEPDGSFALHGATPLAELELEVRAPGFLPQRVRCSRGSSGLLVTLHAGGSVRGRLLAPHGLSPDAFYVMLEDPRTEAGAKGVACAADGRFVVQLLPPGSYDLEVRARLGAAPLARLCGLQVPAEGPCTDPRLDPLDLGAPPDLVVLELAPAHADVALTGWAEVRSRAPNGAWTTSREPISGRRLVLGRRGERLDVALSGPSFRSVLLEDLRGSLRVDLLPRPAPRVPVDNARSTR